MRVDALADPTSLGPWRSSPFWPAEDAQAWVRHAAKTLGPGFHPDTPASGHEGGFTEEPSEEARHRAAAAFELGRLRAFHTLGDRIYAIGLDAFRHHGWAPPAPA